MAEISLWLVKMKKRSANGRPYAGPGSTSPALASVRSNCFDREFMIISSQQKNPDSLAGLGVFKCSRNQPANAPTACPWQA
jgi:hypothetical protein